MMKKMKRARGVWAAIWLTVAFAAMAAAPACGSSAGYDGRCPQGQTLCGDRCTLTQLDPQNCGACGTACSAGLFCAAGKCTAAPSLSSSSAGGSGGGMPAGPPGFPSCDGKSGPFCARLVDDDNNCGGCGKACGVGQMCKDSACCSICGAACALIDSDPKNCGGCGVVCPGGTCTAGKCVCPKGQVACAANGNACTPTDYNDVGCGDAMAKCVPDLDSKGVSTSTCVGSTCAAPKDPVSALTAPSPGNPVYLVLDGKNLYWSESGTSAIMTLPIASAPGTPKVINGKDASNPSGIGVDAANVYWLNDNGTVWKQALAGSSAAVQLSQPIVAAGPIAVDKTNVYFYQEDDNGHVYKVPIEPASPPVVPTLVAHSLGPNGIASDGTNVFYSDDVGIWRVAVAGGAPIALYNGPTKPESIAIDADFVYWTEAASSTISRVAKKGGSTVVIANTIFEGLGLAVDAGNVYFTTEQSQAVMKTSLCGGPAFTLAKGQLWSNGTLAVGATNLYWLVGNDVMTAPK